MSRRATVKALVERSRRFCQAKLSSPKKHYVIITLVVIDVLGIFTDIAISLVTCEMGTEDKPWVKPTQRALGYLALSIASLFMVELMLCIWAFGHRYFRSWFACLDGAIIIGSFLVDLLTHGIIEEIGSLVVILRLWRFITIAEEFGHGAKVQMERLRARIKSLERENALLRESGREPAASGSEPGSGAAPGSRRGPLRDEERAVGVG